MVTVMRPSRARVRKCNDTTPRARCPKTVRERVRPALAIVRDESPDRHGLHCPRRDSDRGMVDTSRGAEQDHSVLCTELRRRPCHDLFPPPALAEGGHRGLLAAYPCIGVPAMPQGAVVAASGASGAAALVALGTAWGKPFPVMAAPAAA